MFRKVCLLFPLSFWWILRCIHIPTLYVFFHSSFKLNDFNHVIYACLAIIYGSERKTKRMSLSISRLVLILCDKLPDLRWLFKSYLVCSKMMSIWTLHWYKILEFFMYFDLRSLSLLIKKHCKIVFQLFQKLKTGKFCFSITFSLLYSISFFP